MSGWIKLHRLALENGWLTNHRLWAFFCYCLLKASHKARIAKIQFQEIALAPGQFIFGRQQAARDLHMTERQIRTCLTHLISTNSLTVKTTNKYSIVTLVNWHTYQDRETVDDQQNDQQNGMTETSKGPTKDQPETTDKKDKKVEKVERTTTTTRLSSNSGEFNPLDIFLSAWRSRYEEIYGSWRGDFKPGTYPVNVIAGLLQHVPIDDVCRDVTAYIDCYRSAKPTPLQFARWSAKRRNINDPGLLELLL